LVKNYGHGKIDDFCLEYGVGEKIKENLLTNYGHRDIYDFRYKVVLEGKLRKFVHKLRSS